MNCNYSNHGKIQIQIIKSNSGQNVLPCNNDWPTLLDRTVLGQNVLGRNVRGQNVLHSQETH